MYKKFQKDKINNNTITTNYLKIPRLPKPQVIKDFQGNIIFNTSDNIFYGNTGTKWVPFHSLTYDRLYQELNPSWDDVNGYYGLAKDAYPAVSKAYAEKATALFNFKQITPNTTTLQYTAITWSPKLGLFCVMRNDGLSKSIYVSSDGINWITTLTQGVDPNISGRWRGITWSEELGLFCAVNENTSLGGKVLISSDGYNWTVNDTGFQRIWRSVCWSKELGLFCAVGSGDGSNPSGIMTSPDGINWTLIEPPVNNGWYGICWSAVLGIFVATAFSGNTERIMISKDGISWNTININNTQTWRNIAWSPQLGLFVAVSNGGSVPERIMISKDGINWNLISNINSDLKSLYSINWSPELGIFCAFGTETIISKDGVNWEVGGSLQSSSIILNSVWSNELGIFCGVSFSTPRGSYISSLKGRPPTSYNVFDSPFNSINESGAWSISQVFKSGTYTLGATTPNVSGINLLVLNNTSGTIITNFIGGEQNQFLLLIFEDSNTTIQSNVNIRLSGGNNMTGTQYDTLYLVYDGTQWLEISKSIN